MKHRFIYILFYFIPVALNAQQQLSGTIKDATTQMPLAGAVVYINNLKYGSSADANGYFQLKNLKKGNYLLEISNVGYKTITFELMLGSDTSLHFTMNTSVTEMNEVVVTGVTHSMELKKSPVVIKTVDQQTLKQISATNLIDALKNIPGVSQITTGGAISKPVIRGLGYNRVISLYNGIRQEGQQWGDEHGIEIDEFSVDRIEIVKGPGSLMYGSDGIAGVLNFISPKPLPAGQVSTQLIHQYQSNNNQFSNSFSTAGNKRGIQWLGRLTNKNAGNFQNRYDGKVYGSGFKESDASLFLGVTKNWGYVHFNVSTFNNQVNLPEGERDAMGMFVFEKPDGNGGTSTTMAMEEDLKGGYSKTFPNQGIHHLRVMSNQYFILNKGTVHLDLNFQNNQRKEFDSPLAPNEAALFFDLKTFNYNLRYNFQELNGWKTSLGVGGMQQSNRNRGEEFLIPAYQSLDIGAFVYSQKQYNSKLNFAAGIRYDNRHFNSERLILDSDGRPTSTQNSSTNIKFEAFKNNYNGISGSIGGTYQLNKSATLKFNYSRGFRAPNIAELSSNGIHEGSFRYEIGDPNLKSEFSNQFDLAYFLNSPHLTLEISPYVNFINNYIFTQKMVDANGNEIIPDPTDPAPGFEYVQGNAVLAGGEFFLDLHPHPLDWLHIEQSFSYVHATQKNQPEESRFLPLIPAPKYRGELRAQFSKTGKYLSNTFIKFSMDHFFKQDRIFRAYDTETTTAAYTLLNAGLGGDLNFGKNRVASLFVNAENLGDLAYQSHLNRLKYAPENPATGRRGIFNMGRNISIKLILSL